MSGFTNNGLDSNAIQINISSNNSSNIGSANSSNNSSNIGSANSSNNSSLSSSRSNSISSIIPDKEYYFVASVNNTNEIKYYLSFLSDQITSIKNSITSNDYTAHINKNHTIQKSNKIPDNTILNGEIVQFNTDMTQGFIPIIVKVTQTDQDSNTILMGYKCKLEFDISYSNININNTNTFVQFMIQPYGTENVTVTKGGNPRHYTTITQRQNRYYNYE